MKPSYILSLLVFWAPCMQASSEHKCLLNQVKETAPQRMVTRKRRKDKLAKYGKVPPTKPITFETFEERIEKEYEKINKKLDSMLEKDRREEKEKEQSSNTIIEEPTSSHASNTSEIDYSSKEEAAAAIRSLRYRMLINDCAAFGMVLVLSMGFYALYKKIGKQYRPAAVARKL